MLQPLVYSKTAVESNWEELPGQPLKEKQPAASKAKEDDGYNPPKYDAVKDSPIHLVMSTIPTMGARAKMLASRGDLNEAADIVAEAQSLVTNNTDYLLALTSYGGKDQARLAYAEAARGALDHRWLYEPFGVPAAGGQETSLADLLDPQSPIHATLKINRQRAAAVQLASEDVNVYASALRESSDPYIAQEARLYSGPAFKHRQMTLAGTSDASAAQTAAENLAASRANLARLRLTQTYINEKGGDAELTDKMFSEVGGSFKNSPFIASELPDIISACAGGGPITRDNATEVFNNFRFTRDAFFSANAPSTPGTEKVTQARINDFSQMPVADIQDYLSFLRGYAKVVDKWNAGRVMLDESGQPVQSPPNAQDMSTLAKAAFDNTIISEYRKADGLGLFDEVTQDKASDSLASFLSHQIDIRTPDFRLSDGADPVTMALKVVSWGENTLGVNDILLEQDGSESLFGMDEGSISGIVSLLFEEIKPDLANYAKKSGSQDGRVNGAKVIASMLHDESYRARARGKLVEALTREQGRTASPSATNMPETFADDILQALENECANSQDGSVDFKRVLKAATSVRGTEEEVKAAQAKSARYVSMTADDYAGLSREMRLESSGLQFKALTGIDPNTKVSSSSEDAPTFGELVTDLRDLHVKAGVYMHTDPSDYSALAIDVANAVNVASRTVDARLATYTPKEGESAPDSSAMFVKELDAALSELSYPSGMSNLGDHKITWQSLSHLIRPNDGRTAQEVIKDAAKNGDTELIKTVLTEADTYIRLTTPPKAGTMEAKINADSLISLADLELNTWLSGMSFVGGEDDPAFIRISRAYENLVSHIHPDASPWKLSSLRYMNLGGSLDRNFGTALPSLVREAAVWAPEGVRELVDALNDAAKACGRDPLFPDAAYSALLLDANYASILHGLDATLHDINAQYGVTYGSAYNGYLQLASPVPALFDISGKKGRFVNIGLNALGYASAYLSAGDPVVDGVGASNNPLVSHLSKYGNLQALPSYAGDSFSPFWHVMQTGSHAAATTAPFAFRSSKTRTGAAITATAFFIGALAEGIHLVTRDGNAEDKTKVLNYLRNSALGIAGMDVRDLKARAQLEALYNRVEYEVAVHPNASFEELTEQYFRFIVHATSLLHDLDSVADVSSVFRGHVAPSDTKTSEEVADTLRKNVYGSQFISPSGVAKTTDAAEANLRYFRTVVQHPQARKVSKLARSAIDSVLPANSTASQNVELRGYLVGYATEQLDKLVKSGVAVDASIAQQVVTTGIKTFKEAQSTAALDMYQNKKRVETDSRMQVDDNKLQNAKALDDHKTANRLRVIDHVYKGKVSFERLRTDYKKEIIKFSAQEQRELKAYAAELGLKLEEIEHWNNQEMARLKAQLKKDELMYREVNGL